MVEEQEWRASGVCTGSLLTNIFFPKRGDKDAVREAKAMCASCPSNTHCLEDALLDPQDDYGIRGGKSAKERQAIRRARGMKRADRREVLV